MSYASAVQQLKEQGGAPSPVGNYDKAVELMRGANIDYDPYKPPPRSG